MKKLLVWLRLRSPLGKPVQAAKFECWADRPYQDIIRFVLARRKSPRPIALPQLGVEFARINLEEEFPTRWSKYDIY